MKIKLKIEREYIFDLKPELKRLKKCFKGKQLERQMDILNAFVEGDLKKMEDLYYALPYCKKRECSEMEYVGLWMSSLGQFLNFQADGFGSKDVVCTKNNYELTKDF
jgi:hypothetical protein